MSPKIDLMAFSLAASSPTGGPERENPPRPCIAIVSVVYSLVVHTYTCSAEVVLFLIDAHRLIPRLWMTLYHTPRNFQYVDTSYSIGFADSTVQDPGLPIRLQVCVQTCDHGMARGSRVASRSCLNHSYCTFEIVTTVRLSELNVIARYYSCLCMMCRICQNAISQH